MFMSELEKIQTDYLESIIGMFDMTVRSSSTVVSMAKTDFRSGSSKQGKQVRASVAANMVAAPNLVVQLRSLFTNSIPFRLAFL